MLYIELTFSDVCLGLVFFFEFYPSYILNVDLEDGDFHCYLRD